jgi:hypothetical protein
LARVTYITVGTVSWYSAPLIADLFRNLTETASDSSFQFIVCDNTNGQDRRLYESLSKTCRIIRCNPRVPRRLGLRKYLGSLEHGHGLDRLLPEVTTEIALFVDPDCRVLARGWDVACLSALYNHIAIGAPYHSSKLTKYHGFPSPVFVCFRAEAFRSIGAKWTCEAQPLYVDIWDQLRRIGGILGSRTGERLVGPSFYMSKLAGWMRVLFGNSSKDTGWRIPQMARKAGLSAKVFTPVVDVKQLNAAFADNRGVLDLIRDFELYAWEGVPMLTHFYGSARHQSGEEAVRRWSALGASVCDTCDTRGLQTSGKALHLREHVGEPSI